MREMHRSQVGHQTSQEPLLWNLRSHGARGTRSLRVCRALSRCHLAKPVWHAVRALPAQLSAAHAILGGLGERRQGYPLLPPSDLCASRTDVHFGAAPPSAAELDTPTGCRFCCLCEWVERRRAPAVGSGALDSGRPAVFIHNGTPASPGCQLSVHPAAGSGLSALPEAPHFEDLSLLPRLPCGHVFSCPGTLLESSTSSTPAPPLLPPPPRVTRVGATRSPFPRPSLLAHLSRRHDDVSVQVGPVHCERPGRVVGDCGGAYALSVRDRQRGHVVVRAVQGQAVAARRRGGVERRRG